MALISSTVPNLINGVSQQPAALRLASQAEAQENCYSSIVEGLKKRPPMEYVARLMTGTLPSAHIHMINRDTAERYALFITDDVIRVFTLAGVEKSIGIVNGATYLNAADAKSAFRTITVADHTFVVNRGITTAMDAALSPSGGSQAIVFVKQAAFESTYTITVNGTAVATHTTGASGAVSTTVIADDLKTSADTALGAGWTVSREGSTILIVKDDGTDFEIKISDSKAGTLLKVAKDKVQRFTDLPTVAPAGFTAEIIGDNTSSFDNYFVTFVTNNTTATFDEGVWEETLAPSIGYKFDASTMPHILVRDPKTVVQTAGTTDTSTAMVLTGTNANIFVGMTVTGTGVPAGTKVSTIVGTSVTLSAAATATGAGVSFTFACDFLFKQATWGEREAGDAESAPDPSFIGQSIRDVTFFKNRLGFLASESVILSRAGKFFEFFPKTVTTILDGDPIDVAAAHNKVAILNYAIAFDEKLLLFSDQTQFVLTGGELLTPKSASIDLTTEFEASIDAAPVGTGKTVYFGVPKGQFTGVREYQVTDTSDTNDAAEITSHVPKYLPDGLFKLASANNEDLVVALASGEQTALWPYKFYWQGADKLQSSWSKWTFNDVTILNCEFINTNLYVVMQRSDAVYLGVINVAPGRIDDDQTFLTLLDMRVDETQCSAITYDAGTDLTTWTIPYAVKTGVTYQVITRGGATTVGRILQNTVTSGSTVSATGDHTTTPVYIGESYRSRYRLSEFVLRRAGQNGGSSVVSAGRLQVRTLTLVFDDTGFFEVHVYHTHREDPSVYEFTGRVLGSSSNVLGAVSLNSGEFSVPILGKSDDVYAEIINDSFLPSNILSAEWEALYTTRSRPA